MKTNTWQFIDAEATFRLENPQHSSYLYFPLVNEAGLMSAITPTLNGDIKTGQNAFLTLPVSVEDLHNTRSGRNFWVYVAGVGPWSATGGSAKQTAARFDAANPERVVLEAGFLWHKLSRENPEIGLRAEVINFVPAGADTLELMQVTLTNITDRAVKITPTAAIPLYGRSADDVRDHRHVTSLLHRTRCEDFGVLVKPTLTFDERGHHPNQLAYAVLGVDENGVAPVGFFPVVQNFIGEGGTLDWPQAIAENLPAIAKARDTIDGYEALGGLRFAEVTLQPGENRSYVLLLAILQSDVDPKTLLVRYGSVTAFETHLTQTQEYWKNKLDTFATHSGETRFDGWLRWVSLQPTLRRLFGNSFLPYHDYGRGGRGWRDLWQDILALLLMERGEVSELLYSNFAGVRLDGSNATIIGSAPGEFKADRNNIPRIWMDHGAWPLLTTQLYIDQTGDLAFLLREQTYFKDHLTHRAQGRDVAWEPKQGTAQKTAAGQTYSGTILEHLLIQHLTPFFNVGEHNLIRTEGADWNDGMDMAAQRGESVAFSALYASNLQQLSELVLALENLGVAQVEVAAEMLLLLDQLSEPLDYSSINAKRQRLEAYYQSCQHTLSGKKVAFLLADLARDLAAKSEWMFAHIRNQEWVRDAAGFGWFNGYYDNDGQRVEGDHPLGIRMTLTGQVFTLMGGLATEEQVLEIVRAADQYLYDSAVGGYRLNTNFGEILLNLGRAFGFAFGTKENGAMFSHMAVMYANALYQRGLIPEGYRVLDEIYQHCQNFTVSRMYPGIPEYIDPQGRGVYPWLTGSASWYLLTMVTQVFGVRGQLGDLVLEPKLTATQFDADGNAQIITLFAGKIIQVSYHNPMRLEYGQYCLSGVSLNGMPIPDPAECGKTVLARELIAKASAQTVVIDVHLDETMMDS
jgi:cellobiose phosphorylase